VAGNGGRPGPYDAATGDVNGSGWSRYGDRHDYLNEPISPDNLPATDGYDGQTGRHRGGRDGRPVRATLWSYEGQQVGQAPAWRDPRTPDGPPIVPGTAEPPDRLDDYWLAGSRARPPVPSRPLDYPPAAYQESFRVAVPEESDLPATRTDRAVPAVSHNGAVRPRERVRGMNAALETGVAGVGEMAPARQPVRSRQMVVAVIVAIIGLVAGALTYKSLATGPVSFSGEIVPTHVYGLSFGAAGTITAVKVHAGDHVVAGEVLATQDDALAQANLQAARDAQAAAAAALYADEHPQQSIVGQRQQAVTLDEANIARQCGTATTTPACQALAAKLTTAKQELAQAQATAASDQQAGQQQEQAAQSRLGERQAALQQVQSQASGVSVTLDQAKQHLAAAKVTVAQDEIALKGTSIIAPAVGTVGAVSAATGDNVTGSGVHNPVLTVDSGPLVVSANLPGTAIGEVRVGQPVTLDIQPLHLSLPGKVVQVNQVASQSQTAVSYTVICQIGAQGTQLMAGMTVNVTPQ